MTKAVSKPYQEKELNDDDSGAQHWPLLVLLVLSVFINYVDRSSLSIAAPLLSVQLSLSPTQVGILLSAFFWTYVPFMVGAGWLVDRYNVKWVLAVGLFVWSMATFSTGLASGLQGVLAMRLLLGVGESVAFPAYCKIISGGFVEHQRGFANALIDAGTKFGPGLGTLVGGMLTAHYGWRALFLSLGLGGLLWLVPWTIWSLGNRGTQWRPDINNGPSILQIIGCRAAWGTFIGNFCANYAWYFLLTWLPSYLVMERHFSLDEMAMSGSLPFLASGTMSVIAGRMSDRWIRNGATATRARKTFVVAGLLFSALVLPAALAPSASVSIMFLTIAGLAYGLFSSNHWAISQTLAGPAATGRWTGLQNAIGNLGGVVSPVLTGWIVDSLGSFKFAFLMAAILLLCGAAAYLTLVGEVVEVSWLSSTDQKVRSQLNLR